MVVCGITAEYSDLNPTPPTEVILIGPDTNQQGSTDSIKMVGRP